METKLYAIVLRDINSENRFKSFRVITMHIKCFAKSVKQGKIQFNFYWGYMPEACKMEDNVKYLAKWKMTSIFWQNGRRP